MSTPSDVERIRDLNKQLYDLNKRLARLQQVAEAASSCYESRRGADAPFARGGAPYGLSAPGPYKRRPDTMKPTRDAQATTQYEAHYETYSVRRNSQQRVKS